MEREKELGALAGKVEDHETRITQMESQMEGFGSRVDSLERWVPLLIQDNKDTMKFVNERLSKTDEKLDKAIEENKAIVKDASTRPPKWMLWMVGTFLGVFVMAIIGVGGWIVESVLKLH